MYALTKMFDKQLVFIILNESPIQYKIYFYGVKFVIFYIPWVFKYLELQP